MNRSMLHVYRSFVYKLSMYKPFWSRFLLTGEEQKTFRIKFRSIMEVKCEKIIKLSTLNMLLVLLLENNLDCIA